MAYGTFKGLKSKYYSEVTYTTDSAYSGISIFITDPKTMSLEEAIYTTGNKKPLAQMNPPGVAANKVVAKTNAAGFDTYGPDGMSFVGWHYVDGKYYLSGEKLSGINDTKLKNYINYQPWRKYPAFCIKTDGTATIRWMNHDRLKVAARTVRLSFPPFMPWSMTLSRFLSILCETKMMISVLLPIGMT